MDVKRLVAVEAIKEVPWGIFVRFVGMGDDVKYLGDIERGKENPTVGILEKVAGALSVKLYQILTFEHELQGEKLLKRRINQILDKCDEKELQMILRLVNAMKD
jgi:transcriptional regulator with XRE-family HTH domain